jgi:prevent-host-death family protein
MFVTATELKNNMGKYLNLATKEDIIITKNGKRIAKLTSATEDKMTIAKSLIGILPSDVTLEEAREEKLKRNERTD